MSLQSLKLNKQITEACLSQNITTPTEIQEKSFSRIMGGQNLVLQGPEGTGKTSLLILSVMMQLKHPFEVAPRALILVSNREQAELLEEEFEKFNEYSKLRFLTVTPGRGVDGQRDELFDGCDVVIGTPDRVQALLLQSGININKVKQFIIEDAEIMIKQGFQTQINRIVEGLPKCQHLLFTQILSPKLEKLIQETMDYPQFVEVKTQLTENTEYLSTAYYLLPNFSTKINLLKYLVGDFKKVVVWTNTRLTAGKLYTKLNNQLPDQLAMKTPLFYDQFGVDTIEDFIQSDIRVLFVSNEDGLDLNEVEGLDAILHFDIDENIDRVAKQIKHPKDTGVQSLFFVNDIELSNLKRLEAYTSSIIEELPLPQDVQIAGTPAKKTKAKEDLSQGGAFHEKKAKNTKAQNFNTRDKRLMKGKVSKRKNY